MPFIAGFRPSVGPNCEVRADGEDSRMEMSARTVRGFTIIELMVAVLIFAILAAIGIPSWRDTIQNNRVAGATNNLVTALNVARSEAVRRGVPVTLCPVVNASVTPVSNLVCATSTVWTNGWMVFADDVPPAGQRTAGNTTGDQVVQVWPAIGGNVIARHTTANANTVNFVRYDVTGMMTDSAKTFRVGATGSACKYVGQSDVSLVGNIRYTKGTCPP